SDPDHPHRRDYGDFVPGFGGVVHVQDAEATFGASVDLGPVEKELLDAIGWDPAETDLAPTVVSSSSSIAEDEAAGAVVGKLSAIDVGTAQVHRLELLPGQGDNDSFSLAADGTLRTTRVFDFEAKSQLTVQVHCVEPNGKATTKPITIRVLDVPEPFVVDTL